MKGDMETENNAFEDKILALYEEWLADEEFYEKRGLTKPEAQQVVMFAIDLLTWAKGVLTGDIEPAERS